MTRHQGNVANLLLARVVARQKEIAIHTALGASRFRAIRQVLTESVLLSLAGGVVGLLLAILGVRVLVASMGANTLPVWGEIQVDKTVLLFTILLSVLTGLVFGVAPAFHATRADVNSILKEGGRTSATGHGRLRNLLVVAEVALAMLLLVGAGLLMKSFAGLLRLDPGFRTENVITAGIALPRARYQEPIQRANFFEQLRARVSHLPGVMSAGMVNLLPMSGGNMIRSCLFEGRPKPAPEESVVAGYRTVTPGYFQTMGIPLLKGRRFTERDEANGERVVIIDETMARRFWPNDDPLGKKIMLEGKAEEWNTIVGIVGDVRHRGLETEASAGMYYPHQ